MSRSASAFSLAEVPLVIALSGSRVDDGIAHLPHERARVRAVSEMFRAGALYATDADGYIDFRGSSSEDLEFSDAFVKLASDHSPRPKEWLERASCVLERFSQTLDLEALEPDLPFVEEELLPAIRSVARDIGEPYSSAEV